MLSTRVLILLPAFAGVVFNVRQCVDQYFFIIHFVISHHEDHSDSIDVPYKLHPVNSVVVESVYRTHV